TILYIKGSLSRRKPGDQSLLHTDKMADVDKIIYPKINFDGRLVKSISVVLEAKWLLCINCDVSVFSQMKTLSHVLLKKHESEKPKSLFTNDWQEKLNMSIHSYLQTHHLLFENLNNVNKKMLVRHLFELGAFNEKNAADYVARTLNLGRATVFKYLKELRA